MTAFKQLTEGTGNPFSGLLLFFISFSSPLGCVCSGASTAGIQNMLMQRPTYRDFPGFIVNHCEINQGDGSGTTGLLTLHLSARLLCDTSSCFCSLSSAATQIPTFFVFAFSSIHEIEDSKHQLCFPHSFKRRVDLVLYAVFAKKPQICFTYRTFYLTCFHK